MLVLAIFSLLTAVALPNVYISPILLTRITSIILLYAAALSFNALYIQSIGYGIGIFSGLFQVTSVSQSIDTFIFLIGAIILLPWAPISYNLLSSQWTNSAIPTIPEYSLIILFTTCGSTFLVSSADFVSMYLSVELQSFALYILATIYWNSESATSAGLKYFLLGGLSSGFILLGSALVYAYTGITNLDSIFSILSVGYIDSFTDGLGPCSIGFTILVVGFLFKISAAPFHNWAPDVYDGVPTIITTWLTIIPKISIFIFLLELQSGLGLISASSLSIFVNGHIFDVWKNLLLVSSLLSLIIGTVLGLAQFRIKWLLAYSTISHVGFLLLALAINSKDSIESFLFYLMQYTITNLNTFLILLAFGYILHSSIYNKISYNTDIQLISDLKGQFISNPLLGFAITVCIFSIAGIPPLIGFFGKQIILFSAVHNGYYFISLIAIIVSVISASYYLKIIRVIHFDLLDNDNNYDNLNLNPSTQILNNSILTNVHSFTIATLTMAITLFVFKPNIILNSTSLLAITLFNN